jgi:hypothetical protein
MVLEEKKWVYLESKIIQYKKIHGPEKQWIPSQYLISEYAL